MPAFAEEAKLDCNSPRMVADAGICADRKFAAADKALNVEYQAARKVAKAWDAEAGAAEQGADQALAKAELAWIAYRDAHCDFATFTNRGGRMEDMLKTDCRTEVTRKRVAELKILMK